MELGVMKVIEVDLIIVLIFYSFKMFLCEWIGLLSDYHNKYDIILPDKSKAKECPTTLRKEDQGMTLLENRKEHLVSRDEMKVMIACDHTQCVTI